MKRLVPKNIWTSNNVVDGLVALAESQGLVDESASDWWGGLVSYVVGSLGGNIESEEARKSLFKDTIEAEYKSEVDSKTMPGAYRSAKSVINKAAKYGVELLAEDGTARGKSEVEKECAELAKASKTNVDKLLSALNTVSSLIDNAKGEGEDLSTVRAILADLYTKTQ